LEAKVLLADVALLAEVALLTDVALEAKVLLADVALDAEVALLTDIPSANVQLIQLIRLRRYVGRSSQTILRRPRRTFGYGAQHGCTCEHEHSRQGQPEFVRHLALLLIFYG
jgi:hypothetical protein